MVVAQIFIVDLVVSSLMVEVAHSFPKQGPTNGDINFSAEAPVESSDEYFLSKETYHLKS